MSDIPPPIGPVSWLVSTLVSLASRLFEGVSVGELCIAAVQAMVAICFALRRSRRAHLPPPRL